MAISRMAAESVTNGILRTRRKLGDPATDPSGNAIPAALRRWTDAAIEASYSEALASLGTRLALFESTEALLYSDTTYTEESPTAGMRLPTAIGAESVYAIEDITNASFPIRFQYVSPLEIQEYVSLDGSDTSQAAYRVYTLQADNTATSTPPYRFKVRPDATGRSLRIWYIASPLLPGLTSDSSPLSPRWNELVATMAAIKLMAVDEEPPAALAAIYADELKLFETFAQSARQKGGERVRLARWRSC